jgi:bifunctional DNase/RNase
VTQSVRACGEGRDVEAGPAVHDALRSSRCRHPTHSATALLLCRPSAYDAIADLLEALGCKLQRVLITECTNTIFFARMFATNLATGASVNVDARPSDAINLALRHRAPVFVNNEVVAKFAK